MFKTIYLLYPLPGLFYKFYSLFPCREGCFETSSLVLLPCRDYFGYCWYVVLNVILVASWIFLGCTRLCASLYSWWARKTLTHRLAIKVCLLWIHVYVLDWKCGYNLLTSMCFGKYVFIFLGTWMIFDLCPWGMGWLTLALGAWLELEWRLGLWCRDAGISSYFPRDVSDDGAEPLRDCRNECLWRRVSK